MPDCGQYQKSPSSTQVLEFWPYSLCIRQAKTGMIENIKLGSRRATREQVYAGGRLEFTCLLITSLREHADCRYQNLEPQYKWINLNDVERHTRSRSLRLLSSFVSTFHKSWQSAGANCSAVSSSHVNENSLRISDTLHPVRDAKIPQAFCPPEWEFHL